jgi:non-homologous end joining protein Ku
MTPATSDSKKVRFHTLNKKTGNRVVSCYVNSITGKPVRDGNEAKGYARGENDYVVLTEAISTQSSSVQLRRSTSGSSFRGTRSSGSISRSHTT